MGELQRVVLAASTATMRSREGVRAVGVWHASTSVARRVWARVNGRTRDVSRRGKGTMWLSEEGRRQRLPSTLGAVHLDLTAATKLPEEQRSAKWVGLAAADLRSLLFQTHAFPPPNLLVHRYHRSRRARKGAFAAALVFRAFADSRVFPHFPSNSLKRSRPSRVSTLSGSRTSSSETLRSSSVTPTPRCVQLRLVFRSRWEE